VNWRRIAAAAAVLAAAMLGPSFDATRASGDEMAWPSSEQLRRELQSAGWHWAANGILWEGGRRVLGDQARRSVLLSGDEGRLRASVILWSDEVIWPWPRSVQSDWTAFMEVVSLLPVSQKSVHDVFFRVLGREPGCQDFPIDGGVITVESDEPPDLCVLRIAQGVEGGCDEAEAPPTDLDDRVPSPPSDKPSPSSTPREARVLLDDLSCLRVAEARTRITNFGLRPGTVTPESAGDTWIVQEHDPAPGALVQLGAKVDLIADLPSRGCPRE
jgi:hypothetical protein